MNWEQEEELRTEWVEGEKRISRYRRKFPHGNRIHWGPFLYSFPDAAADVLLHLHSILLVAGVHSIEDQSFVRIIVG